MRRTPLGAGYLETYSVSISKLLSRVFLLHVFFSFLFFLYRVIFTGSFLLDHFPPDLQRLPWIFLCFASILDAS